MSEMDPGELPETQPNDEVGVPGAGDNIPPPVEGAPPNITPPVTGDPIPIDDGGQM